MPLLKTLPMLTDEQALASNPDRLAFVSASAGTGKTQVLTARVMRLLLAGVRPEAILCLTFTKAGAAEMADRIHARLAHWVRLPDARLSAELIALGEDYTPEDQDNARRLFARVLDAPGGGLRIQTIHSFAQALLAAFPAEAGMTPGFRPIEEREAKLLARETLAAMLVEAEARGDERLIGDVQALSRRLGEQGAEAFLLTCAGKAEALAALGPEELIGDRLREGFGLPSGDVEAAIATICESGASEAGLRRIAAANRAWGAATGIAAADTIEEWLAKPVAGRAEALEALRQVWCTKAGEMRKHSARLGEAEPEYAGLAEELDEVVRGMLDFRALAAFADVATSALRAGARFAGEYGLAKRRRGLVDFDDLIRETVGLLETPGMGDWVRYKLDQGIDHILVDEAQDTNKAQWDIVRALAGEFFEADPREGPRARTIFAVGDFKQAIFGFQGTDPREFRAARDAFGRHAAERKRALLDVDLVESYRSSPPILDFVDAAIGEIGHEAIGLDRAVRRHLSSKKKVKLPGLVTLWDPVTADEAGGEEGEEGWVDDAKRKLAKCVGRQVRAWIDEGLWLEGQGRALRPEDVLILVRSRSELAALLVARLHHEGVPVAGVDRMTLTDPLAIQDLLAALRFALQPEDDLTLASLLVSPLFGLTQDELYAVAFKRKGSLWRALRASGSHGQTVEGLHAILALADLATPYRLLETILSGPIEGRRRLLGRLGEEARDPIEELLNAALAFEGEGTPSLQRFIDWFGRGEVEIKRDPSAPLDAVRVMTVHGAKGLQAPLVILADATADPDKVPFRAIELPIGGGGKVPLPRPRKAEQLGPLTAMVAELKRADRAEHWRLLYVALTRAEERLVIGGSLGSAGARNGPAEASWHAVAERAIARLGCEAEEDSIFGGARHFAGEPPTVFRPRAPKRERAGLPLHAEPQWLRTPAPIEARPPRPLAPSSLGPDHVSDPPPTDAIARAARRGKWLHALFERLPAVAAEEREAAALRWLEKSAGVTDEAERREIAGTACAIIGDPAHAELFGPEALAEAPLAAVVEGGEVVAGTVDRLLIGADFVRVVDFKTGRRAPADADAVPEAHKRQMAAYAAALATIFPGKRIEAALLYTAGPTLIALSDEMLATMRPGSEREAKNRDSPYFSDSGWTGGSRK